MITVAGFNTALDKLVDVEVLRPGAMQRIGGVRLSFGGKGLHVAQTIASFGERVRLVGLVDATSGPAIATLMRERGVEFHGIEVPGTIRTCLAIRERGGRITELLEPGPELDAATREKMLATFRRLALDSDLAVMSGSLPPGCDDATYADFVRELQGTGVRCLVDASGAALRLAIDACPFLVKPNRDEAAALFGEPLVRTADAAAVVRMLLARGVQLPVVSLGADGVVAGRGSQMLHASVPVERVVSAVGSGDCLVAGLAVSLIRGDSLEEMLRLGAACGAANAAAGLGHAQRDDVEALLPHARVTAIGTAGSDKANFPSTPSQESHP
ncbi:MAG TPA: 1-phosphofructokinase family hexose kinase [Rudaea sp.]|nr:1-phosphofructokinase family hexose kinase [Rudaea sp.]